MESLADLIPLLLVGAYYLLRTMRGGRQQRPPTAATPTASEPSGPTPFEQLMRQLEDALEDPQGRTTPSDAEPVEPARLEALPSVGDTDYAGTARPVQRQAEREPAMRAAPKPPRAVPIAFEPPSAFEASFEHEAHGFGDDNPISEEAFESRPAFSARGRSAATDYDPHALKKTPRKAATARRPASRWAARLHDPAAAREALVLKTIFEGPWTPRSGKKGF